jgi:hypothetical protein
LSNVIPPSNQLRQTMAASLKRPPGTSAEAILQTQNGLRDRKEKSSGKSASFKNGPLKRAA